MEHICTVLKNYEKPLPNILPSICLWVTTTLTL